MGKARGEGHDILESKYALRTPQGVEKLLRDKHFLLSRAYYRGDMDAIDIIIDAKRAIIKSRLTEKQERSIYLLFELDYDQKTAAAILDVDTSTLSRNKHAAVKKIAKVFDKWNYS